MAHVEKFKAGAVGRMVDHYDRREGDGVSRANKNIDPSRTHLNYCIGRRGGVEQIQQRMDDVQSSGKKVRSNAVVMADWVITAPPDLRQEDYRSFFESCHEFVCDRYGEENVLGAYVHMDETTPHAHIPFTPIAEKGGGKINFDAASILNRQELRTFHPDLADHVERDLGYRPMVELSLEVKQERAVKYVALDEFKLAQERLERLRGREQELAERNRELEVRRAEAERKCRGMGGEVERAKEQARSCQEEAGRVEAQNERLEAEGKQLAERVGIVEGQRDRAEGRVRALEVEVGRLEGMLARARAGIARVGERIERARDLVAERLRFAPRNECLRDFRRLAEVEREADRLADRIEPRLAKVPPSQAYRIERELEEIEKLETSLERHQSQILEKEGRLADLRKHPFLNGHAITGMEQEIGSLRDYAARLRSLISSSNVEVERMREMERERAEMEREVNPLRDRLDELRDVEVELRESVRDAYSRLSPFDRSAIRRKLSGSMLELARDIEESLPRERLESVMDRAYATAQSREESLSHEREDRDIGHGWSR